MVAPSSRIALAATLAALIIVLPVTPARADDFISDLAACAKAPISATTFAASQAKKAATFVVNHGECVPMVVGGDPLLYGMTGGFVGLQSAGKLPTGTQACVDATLGQASKQVANVLQAFVNKPPMASFIPADGKAKLIAIAQGQTNDALYEVPGIGLVMDRVECSCAVTSSGLDINELKEHIQDVVESIEGCKDLVGKLLGGVYSAAKAVFGAAKDMINDVGCTLGLGGCDDGPPFFCTGYFHMRDGGSTREQIVAIFPGLFPPDMIQSQTQSCEQKYADALIAREKAALEAKATADAEQMGAAAAYGFAFRWIPKCYDQPCKTSIVKFTDMYAADIQDPETIKMYPDFKQLKLVMENKYGAWATLAVAASKKRRDTALIADENAPAADRLDAFGCKLYLGINRQSLCKNQKGYDVCRGYVDGNAWNVCALTGGPGLYSAGRALSTILRKAGCIPTVARAASVREVTTSRTPATLSAQCLSGKARAYCNSFAKGGSRVACSGPGAMVVFDQSRMTHTLAPGGVFIPPPPDTPLPPGRNTRDNRYRAPVTAPPPVEPPPAPVMRAPSSTLRALRPRTSTLCAFERGPRAGQRQDYPRREPLALGTRCDDGRGSFGHIVAP
jgi:hypothetical protein